MVTGEPSLCTFLNLSRSLPRFLLPSFYFYIYIFSHVVRTGTRHDKHIKTRSSASVDPPRSRGEGPHHHVTPPSSLLPPPSSLLPPPSSLLPPPPPSSLPPSSLLPPPSSLLPPPSSLLPPSLLPSSLVLCSFLLFLFVCFCKNDYQLLN